MQDNSALSSAKARLNELSSSTGGRSYYIKKASDLSDVYQSINRELRSQYLLTYYSTSTSKTWRKVEVKATKPDISIRTIRGYLP
ncbi:MAG: hypothetical protein Q7S28_01240 [bacterium]|nr:hypothetical protein [bacterium]